MVVCDSFVGGSGVCDGVAGGVGSVCAMVVCMMVVG